MTNPPAQTLAGVELLAGLAPEQMQAIERRCRWRSFTEGEQIIDLETDSRDVYFIVSGAARVVNYGLSGREVTLDDIGPGGNFGELAALDGQPRSANVVATSETLAASLPAVAFREILAGYPQVALALMHRLTKVIRQSTGRIMDLSTLGAHNRIFAELLREARSGEIVGNKAVLRPIPLHADIASRVSTSRETVARVLNDLARKKIVRRDSDALVLLDVNRLTNMVHEFRGD
ncbi:MAG: Crp/Fnr family transcriptional regulator [Proteobacteria bacterium]|nr:Crp/Fnr family transcriptional regulator [Pseudomonadota bacterium]